MEVEKHRKTMQDAMDVLNMNINYCTEIIIPVLVQSFFP
jgi:hypothetical protein